MKISDQERLLLSSSHEADTNWNGSMFDLIYTPGYKEGTGPGT